MKHTLPMLVALLLVGSGAVAQQGEKEQYTLTGVPALLAAWNEGREDCEAQGSRLIEVHHFDPDTHVIRQNPCVDYEANLLYLLIGEQRSLLIDSGAVDGPWAEFTTAAVDYFLRDRDARGRPLIVTHTHGHQDHRAGDAKFAAMPGVQVAPFAGDAMRGFFGFRDWPNDVVQIDLGNRIVDVIPAPGHHEDHVVFYDRNTKLLFTGDFLLPGRLLVQDIDAYRASAARVAAFVGTHPVAHVLGAHIELNLAGEAFPQGTTFHSGERPLPLAAEDVLALPAALDDFNGFYSRHPHFIVVNPIHNLIALAMAVLVALVLAVWSVRRLLKRRRERQAAV